MAPRVLKKKNTAQSCETLARARVARAFDRFDRIAVSFSGGKDSTVVLNLALEEARRRGRLPLEAFFWDEEAIHPETIAYVERVRALPEVRLRWLCLPVKHRNGCSRRSPWWYPWDPKAKHLWCRPMPENVETALPGFDGHKVPDCNPLLFPPGSGNVGVMLGIRADESMNRYRSVAHSVADNEITWEANGYIARVKPIYDWRTEDVWLAPDQFGWDYNRAYDVMDMHGIRRADQRVAPPYGEEPMRGLHIYAACYPELWDKMVNRVPGAATAARYATTELYAFGDASDRLPPGRTWKEMIAVYLNRWNAKEQAIIAGNIKEIIERHSRRTTDPIPDEKSHPETDVSWRYLAMLACRGDLKGRRTPVPTQNTVKGEGGTRY